MDSQITDYIQQLSDDSDQRFGDQYLVYSKDGEMFAMVHLGSRPLQLDIRCDYQLAKSLQADFESVMPAKLLNPRQWVTVLLTGQLSRDYIEDLLRQSVVQATQQAQ